MRSPQELLHAHDVLDAEEYGDLEWTVEDAKENRETAGNSFWIPPPEQTPLCTEYARGWECGHLLNMVNATLPEVALAGMCWAPSQPEMIFSFWEGLIDGIRGTERGEREAGNSPRG